MIVRFQDKEHFSLRDIEEAIQRNAPDELPFVPLSLALSSPDRVLAMQVCARLALHPDPLVRGNAIISLGHLARRFRSLDEDLVKPLIEKALQDTDDHIKGMAKAAADEIHQFLHWSIRGHVFG